MKNKSINDQLAHSAILPLLVRLTMPVTIAQLVNALYSIVDRMYIGHMPDMGTLALSGVGITFPITMLVSAFSCIPGMGGATLASICIGRGNYEEAERYLSNALLMLTVIGLSIIVLCVPFLDLLLVSFGATDATLPYAHDYLLVYLCGTIFVELSLGLNPFINAQGFTGYGTITVLIGAVLNVILDPIFIYHFNMGIAGAAFATVISQFVSSVWVIVFLCSKKAIIKIQFKKIKPDLNIIKSTCALGVSPFTFRINESIVVIAINHLLLLYGGINANLHIASMAILSSISQIFFMPLIGIITGAQPLLSYNLGSKNFPRIKQTIHYARILSMSCATVMWLMMMFFPNIICMLFSNDSSLISLTTVTMRIMFCTVIVLGLQMVNQNAFVALGNTKYSFIFGIMRKLLFLLPLAFIFPHIFGVWGIYAAEAVSNLLTTIITHIFFQRYMSKLKSICGFP
ncbi:MAG: MATE family efflux transporter [Lachnospiraceae bacterium]|nr:MATE family efflux transporter [Lachnospiraceae bacterium]